MCSNRARLVLVLAAAASCYSCAKPEFTHRVAVLRFENLTPNPDADWVGRAIAEEISGQLEGTRHHAVISFYAIHEIGQTLGGRPVGAPGISAELAAAQAAGANRIVTGYYSLRDNQLSLTAIEENTETHHNDRLYSGAGALDDLLHQADEIARSIDEEARPPITGSARALRSYALGLESRTDQARPLFEDAVALDPDFGPPYVALARIALGKHDEEGFASVFAAARARGNGIPPVYRAILNLEDARLHAPSATRIDALAALVRLEPADPFRLRELADAELETNRFPEAADHYRKLAALLPDSGESTNRLGYALMFGGDEAGATKAFADYRRATGDSANSFDSTGDAQFFFGHFAEAANSYLQSYGLDPHLSDGTDLLKAAWARLMRKDRAGAVQLVQRYSQDRHQDRDGLAPYRIAQFERALGNRDEAARLLAPYATMGPPQVRQAAATQLAWWRFLDGSAPAPQSNSTSAQAIIALVKNDTAAALPLWRTLAEQSNPSEWWIRTVYARLRHEPQRFYPIPQPNRAVGFDELWMK